MSSAAIIAGTIGAVGAIGSSAISAGAASSAASDQASAAEKAQQLEQQNEQQALGFQQNEWNTDQQNLAPYQQAGTGALSNLNYLMGIGGQGGQGGQPTASPGMQTQSMSGGPTSAQNPSQVAPQSAASASPYYSGASPSPILSQRQGAAPVSGAGTATATMPATAGATGGSGAAPSTAAGTTPGGYGSLLQGYGQTFTAPTAAQALNSPGEQAQLQLGDQAMQQSAAAKGNLLTGGTAEALDAYGQNLASTNYQNVYNDALNTFNSGYDQFEQQQNNEYNRLAGIASQGQQAATTLGSQGQQAASNVSSTLLGSAGQQSSALQNAGAANASGVVGQANAWSGGLSNAAGSLGNLAMLNQLYNNNGNSTGASDLAQVNQLQSDGNGF
jgi:hypothetical protein